MRAIRIGRLFGIDLAVDRSWFVIFALVIWSLSGVFQAWHPTWTTGTVFVVALVTAFAFFASILTHELSHALVAKLFGIPVRDITLHLFGGVSNIEREPTGPGSELLVAIAGPIASFAIGIGLIAAFPLRPDHLAELGPTGTLAAWLGPVNVGLGLFNLIPGFPLDGGRVLRAVVWKLTGNVRLATRAATRSGEAVGLIFVGLGIAIAVGLRVPFFGAGLGAGIWLVMIGLFLRGAAKQQRVASEAKAALEGLVVESLMRTSAVPVPSNTSIFDLVAVGFSTQAVTALPVTFQDRFVGIVSLDDVARVPREEWRERTVGEIVRAPDTLPPVAPSDGIVDALGKMIAARTKGLPVVHEGALVGVLCESDVARFLAQRA